MIDSMKRLAAPQNLTALAYTSIKNYILHEDLDERNRLTEEGLSRQLGISKSPVREALNSLHTEGLIRIEARRGAYVRNFSFQEVMDLYGLREALEVYAVGTAAITRIFRIPPVVLRIVDAILHLGVRNRLAKEVPPVDHHRHRFAL